MGLFKLFLHDINSIEYIFILSIHSRKLSYRDLWDWIDSPFDVLPITPKPVKILLPLRGVGQHL